MSEPKKKIMDETEYLLSNPNNAKRLMDGIKNFKEGKTVSYTMEELKAIKEKINKQMEEEASNPEVQQYYKDNLEEIDLKILKDKGQKEEK